MRAEKNYLTPKGYQKLLQELNHLLKEERPKVTETIAWAASNGDRSENADYIYGKKRLREIDRRIRFLNRRLEKVEVIEPSEIQSSRVQFGATVKVENEEGEQKTFVIIGVDESDARKGLISWQSPIGKALLGKEVGDTALVKAPGGEIEFEILSVEYNSIEE